MVEFTRNTGQIEYSGAEDAAAALEPGDAEDTPAGGGEPSEGYTQG